MSNARNLANLLGTNTLVQPSNINLAGTFAFTGTVSGTDKGLVPLTRAQSDTNISSGVLDLDNLSTDYDRFYISFMFHPETDNAQLRFRMLDSSGTVISDSDGYHYYHDAEGSSINSNSANHIKISNDGMGNADHEGIRGYLELNGRNYADSTAHPTPAVFGQQWMSNTNSNGNGGSWFGMLRPTQSQAIRGVRFYYHTGGIASHDVMVYGLTTPS